MARSTDFQCSKCHKRVKDENQLKRHESHCSLPTSPKVLYCPFEGCPYSTTKRASFDAHYSHHCPLFSRSNLYQSLLPQLRSRALTAQHFEDIQLQNLPQSAPFAAPFAIGWFQKITTLKRSLSGGSQHSISSLAGVTTTAA
ncbi:hypothetical protein BOTBODRAFT_36323 [Botryobasidium botryosum FD-172 SS1]|uniref:C2H2-type domain-containing protein n=1 Tax=Botryobasidium botryosum (strain FD-172 SS1) TaxID=930990 RepID=A0A067M3S8_BOTB1|nr:hypothetical protein BOTBODRAFT_36323 [Botryobasidium botryosum FD-172 SS1]